MGIECVTEWVGGWRIAVLKKTQMEEVLLAGYVRVIWLRNEGSYKVLSSIPVVGIESS